MNSIEQFSKDVQWIGAVEKAAEKRLKALARNLAAIMVGAKRKMADAREASDLWELEAYLAESRKTLDRVYQFRYSNLLTAFSILMRDD